MRPVSCFSTGRCVGRVSRRYNITRIRLDKSSLDQSSKEEKGKKVHYSVVTVEHVIHAVHKGSEDLRERPLKPVSNAVQPSKKCKDVLKLWY